MAIPGWYNENSLRHYPLVADPTPVMMLGPIPVPLPTQTVVDIGIEIDVPGVVDPTPDLKMYLLSITRVDPLLTFAFKTSVLPDSPLLFYRSINDVEWTTSESVVAVGDKPVLFMRGYLVTGPLSWLLAVLPSNGMLLGSEVLTLEPSTWRLSGGTYVRSIAVVNYSRLTVSPPGSPVPPYQPTTTLMGDPMVGDIQIYGGYNMALRQDDTTQTLTFSAAVGAGTGTPCAEIPLTDDEVPPDGSQYLTGGPSCSEVVSSINGQPGPQLRMIGSGGVTVMTDPNNPHRIIVDLVSATAAAKCSLRMIAKLTLTTKSPGTQMSTPAT